MTAKLKTVCNRHFRSTPDSYKFTPCLTSIFPAQHHCGIHHNHTNPIRDYLISISSIVISGLCIFLDKTLSARENVQLSR